MSHDSNRFQQKKIDLERESLHIDRERLRNEHAALEMERLRLDNEYESLELDKQRLTNEIAHLNQDYAFNWGVDVENRIIRLTDDIEQGTFEYFDNGMTILEAKSRKAITVKISSYGGEVYEALSIIARIQESKCQIITKGYGKIMSAATAIIAAGHKRSMSELASFMHHEAQISIEGGLDEVKNELLQQEKEEVLWSDLMFNLTGTPPSFWADHGKGKNFYLNADRCLELNIIDEVF